MKEQAKLLNANQPRPIQPQIIVDRDWMLIAQADFAKELIRGALHAAEMGECLENYQAMRAMTPEKLVERCCDTAAEFYKQIEARGWVLHVGLYDDLVKQLSDETPTHAAGFMPKVASG